MIFIDLANKNSICYQGILNEYNCLSFILLNIEAGFYLRESCLLHITNNIRMQFIQYH